MGCSGLTCVAFRDGVLAADRLDTDGCGWRVGLVTKIERLETGDIFGISGKSFHFGLFREWLIAGALPKDRPKLEGGHEAIIIRGTKVYLTSNDLPVLGEVEAPYFALGSGGSIALGAMWHGADAETAVRAAIQHDTHCGGGIDVIRCYEAANQFRPPEGAVTSAPYDQLHPSHFGVRTR